MAAATTATATGPIVAATATANYAATATTNTVAALTFVSGAVRATG